MRNTVRSQTGAVHEETLSLLHEVGALNLQNAKLLAEVEHRRLQRELKYARRPYLTYVVPLVAAAGLLVGIPAVVVTLVMMVSP